MIEIYGLTKRQKILADILWNIDEWDQVQVFVNSLPRRDRIDCEGILEMMRMSLVEQYTAERVIADEFKEAKELINKVSRK
jgi:hypothetical protein